MEQEAAQYVFMFIGFGKQAQRDFKAQLVSFIFELGGTYIENEKYNNRCTHFICIQPWPCGIQKFLGACATGKWVVNPEYVEESRKAGKWLAERDFEWGASKRTTVVKIHPSLPEWVKTAPKRNRIRKLIRHKQDAGLPFKKWVACIAHDDDVKRLACEEILKHGGAKIRAFNDETLQLTTHVFSEKISMNAAYLEKFEEMNVKCLHIDFIRDYILKIEKPKEDDYSIYKYNHDLLKAPSGESFGYLKYNFKTLKLKIERGKVERYLSRAKRREEMGEVSKSAHETTESYKLVKMDKSASGSAAKEKRKKNKTELKNQVPEKMVVKNRPKKYFPETSQGSSNNEPIGTSSTSTKKAKPRKHSSESKASLDTENFENDVTKMSTTRQRKVSSQQRSSRRNSMESRTSEKSGTPEIEAKAKKRQLKDNSKERKPKKPRKKMKTDIEKDESFENEPTKNEILKKLYSTSKKIHSKSVSEDKIKFKEDLSPIPCESTPAERKTRDSTPTGHKTRDSTPTGHKTRDSTPTGRKTRDSTPTGRKTRDSTPTGSKTRDSTPTGSKTRDSTPTGRKTRDSTPTGRKTRDSTPTGRKTRDSKPTERRTTDSTPTERKTTDSTPTERKTTDSTPTERQTTDSTPTERQTTDSTPTERQTTDSTPTERQTTDSTPTERQTTDSTPTERQTTDSTPTERQATDSTPTEPQTTDSTPTEPQTTDSTPTEPQTTDSTLKDEENVTETDGTVAMKHKPGQNSRYKRGEYTKQRRGRKPRKINKKASSQDDGSILEDTQSSIMDMSELRSQESADESTLNDEKEDKLTQELPVMVEQALPHQEAESELKHTKDHKDSTKIKTALKKVSKDDTNKSKIKTVRKSNSTLRTKEKPVETEPIDSDKGSHTDGDFDEKVEKHLDISQQSSKRCRDSDEDDSTHSNKRLRAESVELKSLEDDSLNHSTSLDLDDEVLSPEIDASPTTADAEMPLELFDHIRESMKKEFPRIFLWETEFHKICKNKYIAPEEHSDVEMPNAITELFNSCIDQYKLEHAIDFFLSVSSHGWYPHPKVLNKIIQFLILNPEDPNSTDKVSILLNTISTKQPALTPCVSDAYVKALCPYPNGFSVSPWNTLAMIISSCVLNQVNCRILFKFYLDVFEQDFVAFLRRTTDPCNDLRMKRVTCPALVQIFWANATVGCITQPLEELFQFVYQSVTQSDSDESFHYLITLLGLVAECIRLSDSNCLTIGITGFKCKELVRSIFEKCQLSEMDIAKSYKFVCSLKPSWLQTLLTSELITKLPFLTLSQTRMAEPLSLSKILECYMSPVGPRSPRNEGGENKLGSKWKDSPESPLKATVINRRNRRGETRLHVACMENQPEKLKKLLDVPGVDVNIRDYAGWTPLHEACNGGFEECVSLLLKYNPGNKNASQRVKKDPVDLMAKSNDGTTPMHDAICNDHVDVVRCLLERGGLALLNIKSNNGFTPMDQIKSSRMKDLIRTFTDENHCDHKLSNTHRQGFPSGIRSLEKENTPITTADSPINEIPEFSPQTYEISSYLSLLRILVKSYLKMTKLPQIDGGLKRVLKSLQREATFENQMELLEDCLKFTKEGKISEKKLSNYTNDLKCYQGFRRKVEERESAIIEFASNENKRESENEMQLLLMFL